MRNSTYCFKQANRFRVHGNYDDFCFWATKAIEARKIERRKMRRSAGRAFKPRYIERFRQAVLSLDLVAFRFPHTKTYIEQSSAA